MKKLLRTTVLPALLPVIVVLVASCGSTPPARFYTLASVAGSGEGRVAARPQKIVGIGPVALAAYLNYPGITTRNGPNTVSRSELDRWGGALGDEVTRVLVENVGQLTGGGSYLVLPWLEAAAVDYRLQLNITRFDGPLEGPVVLNAGWLLFGGERNTLLAAGDAAITEPVEGAGYPALSAAMSRALAELSRRLAKEIDAAGNAGR